MDLEPFFRFPLLWNLFPLLNKLPLPFPSRSPFLRRIPQHRWWMRPNLTLAKAAVVQQRRRVEDLGCLSKRWLCGTSNPMLESRGLGLSTRYDRRRVRFLLYLPIFSLSPSFIFFIYPFSTLNLESLQFKCILPVQI